VWETNGWEAGWLLGQVHHKSREPAQVVECLLVPQVSGGGATLKGVSGRNVAQPYVRRGTAVMAMSGCNRQAGGSRAAQKCHAVPQRPSTRQAGQQRVQVSGNVCLAFCSVNRRRPRSRGTNAPQRLERCFIRGVEKAAQNAARATASSMSCRQKSNAQTKPCSRPDEPLLSARRQSPRASVNHKP